MNTAMETCSIPDCYINRIITGDARELAAAIPNDSVDLVICDPPYLKKDVESGIYAWLAREAAQVLKPGGFCLAYCPTYWKPTALSQMSEHLTYFWDYIVIQMGDGNGLAWGRRTQICYVSILAFQKAGARVMPPHSIMDVYHADRANKRDHKWGQSEVAAQYYVDCFTRPGDLAFDPEFIPAPILCDNNLSALPVEYQEHIIRRYQAFNQPLLDANSGFEPRSLDEDTYHRWKPILRGPWRFALDEMRELEDVRRTMTILKGVPPRRKRVYCLVGNEPIGACYERALKIIEYEGEPFCQYILPLNWLGDPAKIRSRFDWTYQLGKDFCRFFNRFLWRSISLEEYRPRQDEPPPFKGILSSHFCSVQKHPVFVANRGHQHPHTSHLLVGGQ